MALSKFDYFAPEGVEEVCRLLRERRWRYGYGRRNWSSGEETDMNRVKSWLTT